MARLSIALLAACLLAGCSSDTSMSETVKPNPEMANRYKQPTSSMATPPKGIAGGNDAPTPGNP